MLLVLENIDCSLLEDLEGFGYDSSSNLQEIRYFSICSIHVINYFPLLSIIDVDFTILLKYLLYFFVTKLLTIS